jgi:hypothetical protein
MFRRYLSEAGVALELRVHLGRQLVLLGPRRRDEPRGCGREASSRRLGVDEASTKSIGPQRSSPPAARGGRSKGAE